MEETIFEGQYDHVMEDNHHEILDEIAYQLRNKYGELYDDSQIKFRIKIEVIDA